MPQEFQVLRCVSCETFQVHIVKMKNVKWECKLCRFKQSIKHVYSKSSVAMECRAQVQMLNSQRGVISDLECGKTEFAQQIEILNESCLENSRGNYDRRQTTVEEDFSTDSMTSQTTVVPTTSRSTYYKNTSCEDKKRHFETKNEAPKQKQKKPFSKWSKYIDTEEEGDD